MVQIAPSSSRRAGDLLVTLTWIGPEALAMVNGRVDPSTIDLLRTRLDEAVARGARRITLEVSQVRFLSPVCTEVLTDVARRLRAKGGDLVVLDAPPPLRGLLSQFRLDGELSVVSAFGDRP